MTFWLGVLVYAGCAVITASVMWSIVIVREIKADSDDAARTALVSAVWPIAVVVGVAALMTIPARLARKRMKAARAKDAERRSLLGKSVEEIARSL